MYREKRIQFLQQEHLLHNLFVLDNKYKFFEKLILNIELNFYKEFPSPGILK